MARLARWASALLAMTLLSNAAAQLAGPADLTANSVAMTGASEFHAPFVATWTDYGTIDGVDGVGWQINASHLDLRRETKHGTIYAGPNAFPSDPDVDVDERPLEEAAITVTGLATDSYIIVMGQNAQLGMAGPNLEITGRGEGSASEPEKDPDQQAALSKSWTKGVAAASSGATTSIGGDFSLAIWGATLEVTHAQGDETWQSGRYNRQADDPTGTVTVVDETWIYLDISSGALTIPAREIPAATMIAGQQGGSLTVEGALQARGATGELLGHTLDGQDILVSGSLQADDVAVQDGRLAFALKGDADSYVLKGQRIEIAIAPEPQQDGVSWFWSFAAVPVLAAWLVRRQQPARRVARIRDALGRGHFDSVTRRAPRWFGTKFDREARIATAVANLRLDAPERAMEALEEGDVPLGTKCFLRAHAFAIMGQISEARALLREALETSPHMRYEAERNPALAPLLSVGSTEAYA